LFGGREVSDGQAQSEFGLDRISEFGPDRSPCVPWPTSGM
jgi:hypothetical protein